MGCEEVRASYERRMDVQRAEELALQVAQVMGLHDWLVFVSAQTPWEYRVVSRAGVGHLQGACGVHWVVASGRTRRVPSCCAATGPKRSPGQRYQASEDLR